MDMFHHRQEVFVALDGVAIGQADVQEWQLLGPNKLLPKKLTNIQSLTYPIPSVYGMFNLLYFVDV